MAVLGIQVSKLVRDYLVYKKGKQEIEDWINHSGMYKSHAVTITDTAFVYTRDTEKYVYEFNRVKKTYRNELYFYYETLDNDTILLPVKAFEAGEFTRFLKLLDGHVQM